jgi:hypothetical protein
MRSTLEVFGDISLATKDTDVYSADELDWNTIDARALRFKANAGATLFHRDPGSGEAVVFTAKGDFISTDGFIPFITSDPTINSTTKHITGPQVDTVLGIAPVKGVAWVLPLPHYWSRYMRAGATPKSSGTFTAKTVHAHLEFGPIDNV